MLKQRRRKAQEKEKVPTGCQKDSLVATAPPPGQARPVAAPQRVPLRPGQLQGEDKEGEEASATEAAEAHRLKEKEQ